MSGERESLWGVQRRMPTARGDERVDEGAGGNPKEAHVLDLQQKAGNAAVTGVVQRSLWGDDSWLGGVGSMFPATGGSGMGFPDLSKVVTDDSGAGAGAAGGKVDDGGGYKDPYGGGGGKMEEPAGGKFDDPYGGGGKMDDPYGDGGGFKDPYGGGGGGGVIVGDDYKDTGGKW